MSDDLVLYDRTPILKGENPLTAFPKVEQNITKCHEHFGDAMQLETCKLMEVGLAMAEWHGNDPIAENIEFVKIIADLAKKLGDD